jgi:hypothetical protein
MIPTPTESDFASDLEQWAPELFTFGTSLARSRLTEGVFLFLHLAYRPVCSGL